MGEETGRRGVELQPASLQASGVELDDDDAVAGQVGHESEERGAKLGPLLQRAASKLPLDETALLQRD